LEDALEQMLRKGFEEDGPGKLFGLKVVVGKERMTAEFTVTPPLARTGDRLGGAFVGGGHARGWPRWRI
jgi:hypothetical protein